MWQGGDLVWGASTHNITQPFKYVSFENTLQNQKHLISTTAMPEPTKISSVVINGKGKGLPTILSTFMWGNVIN